MGSISYLKLLARFSNVLSWYASIRAIETDEESRYQQCLRYWVLFSITAIFEWTFAKLLVWLSFWPFVKGVGAAMLAVPSFAGASYVYTRLVRPYVAVDDTFLIPDSKGCLHIEPNGVLVKAGMYNRDDGEELEKVVTCEGESEATSYTTRNVMSHPGNIKQVQREWSCPLCLISTTSENCLKMHLKGKKHKMKECELRQANNSIVERFNLITWVNYETLSGFISPVVKSNGWSVWIKPGFGWMKLNTDGSIDRRNSTFGGLLRDYNGDPVCAYISKAPGDDIFLAELWAIWRGLVLALGLRIKAIWVESDSMSVVKTINKEQVYRPKASSCLEHIWILLSKFEMRHVSYAWRETNRAADYLSRMEILGSDTVLWPGDFPNNLCRIIQEDALGRRYYRR